MSGYRGDQSKQEAELARLGYKKCSARCPVCNERLWQQKHIHRSHDYSYITGYSLYQGCTNCGYSEVYHDVE